MSLLYSKAPTNTSKRKDGRQRFVEGRRRRRVLIGFSLVLAFAGSALVLLLSGSLQEEQEGLEQLPDEMVEREVVAEEAPGPDTVALRDRLEEVAQEYDGTYGVAVLDPDSGTKISLRGDEEFMAASIGKLPVLAALYRAGAQGELDLEEEIPILPADIKDYGDGELMALPEEDFLSLRDSAYRMVNYSDNITWSMLDRRLGVERIRNELEEMGIRSSWYSDDLSGYFTTPNDMLLLLEKISDPQFTSKEFGAEMLNAMTETHLEDRIPKKLPLEVRVAHKTGSYGDNFSDAGIVFYKDSRGVVKHYNLVVLAKGTGEYEARDAIQSISLAVYEALTGTEVDPGWSRGEIPALQEEEEILAQEGMMEGYLP